MSNLGQDVDKLCLLESKTNKDRDNLLSICKSVPLRICNGRKLGDLLGSYTCYTPNGQSCVDYCLASSRIYENTTTLTIGEPILTLSDHCPVRVVLKVKVSHRTPCSENYDIVDNPVKIGWSQV